MARPRTVSLEPDEMIKLGGEMLDWVELNKPLHLSAWYSLHMGISEKQWDVMQRTAEFYPYYEMAIKKVGQLYLDKNSNVREGISQRWQRVYFKDLRKQEDEDLVIKANAAASAASTTNANAQDIYNAIKRDDYSK